MAGTFLAAYANGRWTIGLGDRSPLGWTTVVVYFLAAACTALAAPKALRERKHWVVLTLIMVILCLCKSFDFPGFFTDAFRYGFMQSEKGEFHGAIQQILVIGLLAIGIIAIVIIFYLSARSSTLIKTALAGIVYLIAFISIRAISLHTVDHLLRIRVSIVTLNQILELAGLALVIIPAMMQIANARLETDRR